ncbi:membrane protein required for colicin V production [Candidatus Liberibacter solanacearum]|uniref:Colicin V production protein n=1 Tax=Candidatus Liberibacter solanacearum TaxID=556287 RepID=A0A094YZN9_9HYPH|nr:CvpA family protein [Candidatus Liberibacter solanacearum]KGB27435.1 colicin V production protein [Candidatus Liberibacter solanacearum]KJZ81152.1 colicin V production protein [Candidatus Liberibacter solanacearum]KJZ82369.1 Colicin V production protein [Candidatus Liberibacter solanacearum]KQC49240.1 colicin V production protein [Candidatus Liberibacter solanacearum]RPD37395.1 CvpA family protein [Candidatus Liberibacter solanacearum]
MGITYFDIFCLGFILISAILAMVRGILSEMISLTNWIFSAIITRYLYLMIFAKGSEYFQNKQIALIATIVPLFLIIFTAVSILLRIISKPIYIRSVFLDKILGCLFGGVRGLFLLVIATSCWNLIVNESKEPEWIQKSISKKIFDDMATKLKKIIPRT